MPDLPTIPTTEKDQLKQNAVIRQLVAFLANNPPLTLGGFAASVNLATSAVDNIVSIFNTKPYYYLHSILIKNRGPGSVVSATAGIFSSTGGSSALAATQVLSALTTSTSNTPGGLMIMTLSSNNNQYTDRNKVYFRVGSENGTTAVVDIYCYIQPLP